MARCWRLLSLLYLAWRSSPGFSALSRSEVLRGTVSAAGSALAKPRSLKYGRLVDQVGDLWLPQAPSGLVVLLHGGFWLPQYGKDLMTNLAKDLVSRNWAAWNVEYRRVAGSGWKDANSTLEDIKLALQFLDSSDFPLEVGSVPVALVGHSAGGHLALWSQLAGLSLPPIRAAISAGGVLDLCYADEEELGGGAGAVARFLGYRDVRSLKRQVSPIDMLPPCLVNSLPTEEASRGTVPATRIGLVHGKKDDVVPDEQSIRFIVSSTCAGIPCELHLMQEEGHYEVLSPSSASWRAVISMVQQAFGQPLTSPIRTKLQTQREERGDEWIFRSRPVS